VSSTEIKNEIVAGLQKIADGAELAYISGRNKVTFRGISADGTAFSVDRGGEAINIGLSRLDDICEALASRAPVHVDTVLGAGGSERTVIETCLAHTAHITWKSIDGRKHLEWSDEPVHFDGETFNSGSGEWTASEWALSTVIFEELVAPRSAKSIPLELRKLLSTGTRRNEAAWNMRIGNFRVRFDGSSFSSGEATQEKVTRWLELYSSKKDWVRELAPYAVLANGDGEKICNILTLSSPRGRIALSKSATSGSEPFEPDDKNAFVEALGKCGFLAEEGLPAAFLQSLLAKPFVILTGNSGTGKTKIAELLAAWLRGDDHEGHELVAVGADWTDNRNVVGFVNYLRLSGDGKTPLYQSTHLLDLLMRARATPGKPFFLILDEMNLSHVERYFADFLSAMESRAGELDLHSDGGELKQLPVEPDGLPLVPRKLAIPANVFVIGTVNVDETTYMFSPKVLDRANVIEFRMPDNAVESFLKAGGSKGLAIEYAGNGVSERFLALSTQARADLLPEISDAEATKNLSEAFAVVFGLMRDSRLEFGFRTINEIRRYLRVDYELAKDKAAWSWQNAFDAQLLQKILPKLSGSRRKLEDLLVRLAIFCESGKTAAPGATAPAHLQSVPVKREAKPQYPNSYRKLCDMLDAVRRDQFVSFIH
jgi:hypothetical protein